MDAWPRRDRRPARYLARVVLGEQVGALGERALDYPLSMTTHAGLFEDNSQLRQLNVQLPQQIATLMKIVEGERQRIAQPERQINERETVHAIRPAVLSGKSAGGIGAYRGPEPRTVLISHLRTVHHKSLGPQSLFTAILRAPKPAPEPLLLG